MTVFSQDWRPPWMLTIRKLAHYEHDELASLETPWLLAQTSAESQIVEAKGGQANDPENHKSSKSSRWIPPSERLRRQQLAQTDADAQPETKQALPGWVAAGCVMWVISAPDDQAKVRHALQDWPGSVEVRDMSHPSGYVVYVPSSELKNIPVGTFVKEYGLVDIMYLQSPPELRGAMSLGLYSSEDTAMAELKSFEKRGVKGLKMAYRMGPLRTTYILKGSVAEMGMLPTPMALVQRGELRRC